MYETIEYIEVQPTLSERNPAPLERVLGSFEAEAVAIECGREARRQALKEPIASYAWWIVREEGAQLAQWIADSHSDKEFALDLDAGQLIEVAR